MMPPVSSVLTSLSASASASPVVVRASAVTLRCSRAFTVALPEPVSVESMTAADSLLVAVASASPLVLSASARTVLVPVSGVPAFSVTSPLIVCGALSTALTAVLVEVVVEAMACVPVTEEGVLDVVRTRDNPVTHSPCRSVHFSVRQSVWSRIACDLPMEACLFCASARGRQDVSMEWRQSVIVFHGGIAAT